MSPIKALTVALCMIVTRIQLSIAIADDPMISLDAITQLLRLEPCQCVLCWAMWFQWVEPLLISQRPSCILTMMQVRS